MFLFPKDPFDFLDELEKDRRKSEYQKGLCILCRKDLMPDTDAYWGREPRGRVLCYDCRKKEKIEG